MLAYGGSFPKILKAHNVREVSVMRHRLQDMLKQPPFKVGFVRRVARFGVVAASIALSLPAWSQGGFEADVIKNYGGSYSSACRDASAPRLLVIPNALIFTQGGKSITGRDVLSAYTYFGNSPPDDFRVALMSQVKGNTSMVFIVYEDKQGQYITLEADDKLSSALGKVRMNAKYRYCDGPRQEPAGKSSAATKAPPEAMPPYGFDLFKNPQFKALYTKTAGPLTRERWLATLEGPTGPLEKTSVDGREFVVANSCKPHDCYDHNVLFFYAASRSLLYGKVYQAGKVTLIGSPPPAVATELDRKWMATFRR